MIITRLLCYFWHIKNGILKPLKRLNMLNNILNEIVAKHKKLLILEPKFPKELTENLYDWFRIALTYTSNAIEGNTLSEIETAQIIEKDITVPGKSLTEHLEAINHAKAVDLISDLAKSHKNIEISDILSLYRLILGKINDKYAGTFRNVSVRIMGSSIPVPNYQKIPQLMDDLISWLHSTNDPVPKISADIHLKLAYIHPFIDGNGRTARLLMNLILLRDKYPLVFIKAQERTKYIQAIQKAVSFACENFSQEEFILKSHDLNIKEFYDFYSIIFEAIEFSLDEYLDAVK